MRAQIAVFLVLAAGVAGCASTPPPAPTMAAAEPAPSPPPAPMTNEPVSGMYKGPIASTDDSRPRCRKMPAMASTRVSNNSFVLGGIHAKIGQDGNVVGRARSGTTMTGTLANDSLDVTTMGRGCGYHYSLARS